MMRTFPSLLLLLLLAGCTSYRTQVEGTGNLTDIHRCFVLTNANDNHALDRHLVNALRAHGLTADSGPRTMMPETADVIVAYQDNWTWDFGERLAYLQITLRDRKTGQPVGQAKFSAKIPGKQTLAEVTGDLVGRLFPGSSP